MGNSAEEFRARYRVAPGGRVDLRKLDPRDAEGLEKEEAKAALLDHASAIDHWQDRLFAEGKRAVLVVLQGMDTSGKDGTIRSVFNTAGPLGVSVASFREPSEEELAHDFLWRVHQKCPRRGMITLFNRSHYEDVLVVKVKGLASKAIVDQRYEQINAFEKMLVENGTTILKFMLHISKEEQAVRLQERLDDPAKQWKFNPGDLKDRELWEDYRKAYESMLERCSTPWAPWYVVPSDINWIRNAVIAQIVRSALEQMNPSYPEVPWKPEDFKIA